MHTMHIFRLTFAFSQNDLKRKNRPKDTCPADLLKTTLKNRQFLNICQQKSASETLVPDVSRDTCPKNAGHLSRKCLFPKDLSKSLSRRHRGTVVR